MIYELSKEKENLDIFKINIKIYLFFKLYGWLFIIRIIWNKKKILILN